MRKPLYIYGAGGLGRELLALIRHCDEWEPIGFIDDQLAGSKVRGLPVMPGVAALQPLSQLNIIVAIGNPLTKMQIVKKLPPDVNFPVLIHPTAVIMDTASVHIGRGSVLTAGTVLTSDIIIGDHVLVNLNATIGHNSKIGSFSSIMPGVNVAGEVTIGDCVLLGSGCNIRNSVIVGSGAQVGMGAVVIEKVPEGETVVGVPAKVLVRKRDGSK